jgi:hypothetical protein
MQKRWRVRRETAYRRGRDEFEGLTGLPTFRDFVCLYVAEGSKRDRNVVALGNSDPAVVALATRWFRHFASNPLTFWIQYHADQDPAELSRFWADAVDARPDGIRHQRKSNSAQLSGRSWRSPHGVLTVRACDTIFRARLQGWIDRLQEEWSAGPLPPVALD